MDFRPTDKIELTVEYLAGIIQRSEQAWTVIYENRPVAIFGVVNVNLADPFYAWVVTDKVVDKHKVQFVRAARRIVLALRSRFGPIAADGEPWLRLLGFRRESERFVLWQ